MCQQQKAYNLLSLLSVLGTMLNTSHALTIILNNSEVIILLLPALSHFTKEKTETEELSHLLKFT